MGKIKKKKLQNWVKSCMDWDFESEESCCQRWL